MERFNGESQVDCGLFEHVDGHEPENSPSGIEREFFERRYLHLRYSPGTSINVRKGKGVTKIFTWSTIITDSITQLNY